MQLPSGGAEKRWLYRLVFTSLNPDDATDIHGELKRAKWACALRELGMERSLSSVNC